MLSKEDITKFIQIGNKHFPDKEGTMEFAVDEENFDGEWKDTHPFIAELIKEEILTGDIDIDKLIMNEIEASLIQMVDAI